jgi:hypothetical protein
MFYFNPLIYCDESLTRKLTLKYSTLTTEYWRVSYSGIWRRVVRSVGPDVSEELIAFISGVEEIGSANQRASRWQTSGPTKRTTRRHIPEDDTLHNQHCENLKSYNRVLHSLLRFLFNLNLNGKWKFSEHVQVVVRNCCYSRENIKMSYMCLRTQNLN